MQSLSKIEGKLYVMEYKVYRDENTIEKFQFLAQIRLEEFVKFPYLYQGSMAEEKEYAKEYQVPGAILITCSVAGEDIGVISGYLINGIKENLLKLKLSLQQWELRWMRYIILVK